MSLSVKEIYVLKKKSFFTDKENFVIDYLYLDKNGNFNFGHSYLDSGYDIVDFFGSINKDGSLSIPGPYLAKGHYSNFKFYADSIIERE